jgi:hypothetical protein
LSTKKPLKNKYLRNCESLVTVIVARQASIDGLVEFSSRANAGLQADSEVV